MSGRGFFLWEMAMPYRNIVFAKLEKRLFNDYRWYMMSEEAQLNYVRFIMFACETYNKIPKNIEAIKLAFKTNQDLKTIERTIEEIKINFPKFRKNKHFYYFNGFDEKTNYISKREIPRKSQGVAKEVVDKDKDKDKEEDKEKDKESQVVIDNTDSHNHKIIKNKEKASIRNKIPPDIEDVKLYCQDRANGVNAQKWMDHYQAKGWLIGKNKMKDWQAAVRTWEKEKPFVQKKEEFTNDENLMSGEERRKMSEEFKKLTKKIGRKVI